MLKQVATLDPVPVQISKAVRRRPDLLERYKESGDMSLFETLRPEGVPLPETLCMICSKCMERDQTSGIRPPRIWLKMLLAGSTIRVKALFKTGWCKG